MLFDDILQNELNNLRNENLYRALRCVEGRQGPTITIGGRKFINLSSNNYLGLSNHPALVSAVIAVVKKYGAGAGASRLMSGTTRLHMEIERRIAEFKNTEDSIVFSSGYLANIGTITSLVDEKDIVIGDRLNHASLIDGCRLSGACFRTYPHLNLKTLEDILSKALCFRRRLIVTDTIFSMDGDIAPLSEIVSLADKYDAFLMIDDAHSTGVLGKEGRGGADYFGLGDRIHVQMGTLSKALGSIGGYVAGSKALIDYLRNKARSFIYSTALPPAVIAASIAALKIIRTQPSLRETLHKNAQYLKDGLRGLGFDILNTQTQIIPVFVGTVESAIAFSKKLYKEGIFAPAIRPPTVSKNRCRLRLSVMSTHKKEHLDRVLEAFKSVKCKVRKSYGVGEL